MSFELWYSKYPRRQKRADARKAWWQVEETLAPIDEMLATLEWQKKSAQWLKDDGQYIPLPASYLRAEQWCDEPTDKPKQERPINKYEAASQEYQKRYGGLISVKA